MWWKYVLMYENEKTKPVETTPGLGGKDPKMIEGGEFNYDIL
jgi:hypothetical protein